MFSKKLLVEKLTSNHATIVLDLKGLVTMKATTKATTPKTPNVKDTTAVTTLEKYAIFQTGGKQYQAVPGKTLALEKIEGSTGDALSFNDVLLRKTGENKFEFGQPFVKGATIKASIVKQSKEPKVIIFKFQRRKKVRTKTGHRQPITVVRIESV